jgi:hypothetical protein
MAVTENSYTLSTVLQYDFRPRRSIRCACGETLHCALHRGHISFPLEEVIDRYFSNS